MGYEEQMNLFGSINRFEVPDKKTEEMEKIKTKGEILKEKIDEFLDKEETTNYIEKVVKEEGTLGVYYILDLVKKFAGNISGERKNYLERLLIKALEVRNYKVKKIVVQSVEMEARELAKEKDRKTTDFDEKKSEPAETNDEKFLSPAERREKRGRISGKDQATGD